MSDTPRSTAARAQRSPAVRAAARLGYAVNGLLNITIGALALAVAMSSASGSASPGGALAQLAQGPGGRALIWVIAIGMAALVLWQLASAVLEPHGDARQRWMTRLKFIGKALAYLAIAVIAFRIALRGGGGGDSSEEDIAAGLLAAPGGVILIVLIALVALGVGGFLVVKGVKREFLADVSAPAGTVRTAVTVLGVVGYIARGIAIGVIGILFITAAFSSDASKAGGLDDALAALAALPFGRLLLVAIAIGFIAYGVYSFVRARYARL